MKLLYYNTIIPTFYKILFCKKVSKNFWVSTDGRNYKYKRDMY